MGTIDVLDDWASTLVLGDLLLKASEDARLDLLHHWQQGEFHHDYVFQVRSTSLELGSDILVVSTNCNAGIKELLLLSAVPERWALWRWRCPENADFEGQLPPILRHITTVHWFEPCKLLAADARSELRPEARRRQRGGGWIPVDQTEE